MAAEGDGFNRFFDIEESIVEAGTAFRSPKARHLHEWWLAAAGGGLPSRRLFDILDHKPIVGSVFLTEARGDGRFVFRLIGEAVIDMVGGNRTGEAVEEARGEGCGAAYGHALHAYYRRVVETRACWRCTGLLAFPNKGFRRFESIDCPLADDGAAVDTIIGVMDLVR